MYRKTTITMVIFVLMMGCAWMAVPAPCEAQSLKQLAFSGGPDGGTFQIFSNAISTRVSREVAGVRLSNMVSAGSVENLRRNNSSDADFGMVYAGDLYLARNGLLTGDKRKYKNVYALAFIYGAPAQLITREDSGIKTVQDLKGKRVAVGGAGSGAAASAQRYFTSLGLWDQFTPEYIGYSQGASALGDKLIDAMWALTSFPNASIIQAAASNKIRLIDLVQGAKGSTFSEDYPFYTEVKIPAGTYQGVDYDVMSVQDSTIWTAGRHVDSETVYTLLKEIYSPDGLKYLHSISKTAKAMTIKNGLSGIATPVHPGAAKFWQEQGLTLTDRQKLK